MRKLFLAAVFMLLLVPYTGVCQVPGPGQGAMPIPGMGLNSGVPGTPPMPLQSYSLFPQQNPAGGAPRFLEAYIKGGYQWLNFDANFPVLGVDPHTSPNIIDTMDFQLKDGNFWVGFTGVRVTPIEDITLYAEVGANAQRDCIIKTGIAGRITDLVSQAVVPTPPGLPGLNANLVSPWNWTAAGFQWWMIDAGIAWNVSALYSLEFGFHEEHIDYRMQDPRNGTERVPIIGEVPITGTAITGQRICPTCQGTFLGDPMSKVWFPYIGITGTGRCCKTVCCPSGGTMTVLGDPNYRWRVRGAPIVWNRWQGNVALHLLNLPGETTEEELWNTDFKLETSGGGWIEGEFEGFLSVTSALRASLWGMGSWLSIAGTGQRTQNVAASTIIGTGDNPDVPLVSGTFNIGNSSYTQSIWALGLGLWYVF